MSTPQVQSAQNYETDCVPWCTDGHPEEIIGQWIPSTALAILGERDLHNLRAAIDGFPTLAPGLLAWLEHAVGWEIDRRAGLSYPLLGLLAAIDDTEIECSLVTLVILAASFRGDGQFASVPVAEFLDAAVATLHAEIQLSYAKSDLTGDLWERQLKFTYDRQQSAEAV